MADCEFDEFLKCVHCGYQARRADTRRNCAIDRPPSLLVRLRNYEAALARWLAAGRPVRSDAEVEGLLAICESNRCGAYREGTCLSCGCPVNRSGFAVRNKLRMATEQCPRGEWTRTKSDESGRNQTLRVGILTPNLYVGGVESWICSLVREWRASGDVEPVGVGHLGCEGTHRPALTSRLTPLCPIVSACEIAGGLRVRSSLDAAAVVASAADVVLCWSVAFDTLQQIKRPGLTVVGVSHGCHDWWMRAAAPLVDHWAAVSRDAVSPIPVSPEEVTVIPNGIDLERCASSLTQAQARRKLGLTPEGRIAGYVGRISEEKRIAEIAAAAAYLLDDWRVLIVGEGVNPAYLQAVERASGRRVVRIDGAVSAVGDVWRACDVAVVASAAEGYCLSAVEALAAGVPLASTAVGVVRDITTDVAVIPQPAKPQEIASAVLQAFRSGISPRLADWTRQQGAGKMASAWAKYLETLTHKVTGHD